MNQHNDRRLPQGGFVLLRWLCAKLFIAAVVLALGYFFHRYILTDQLDEQIRQQIEAKFRDHYPALKISLESARRVEGEGIEIRGLRISEPGRSREPPLLYVERINVSCDVDLQQLLTCKPTVSKVVMRQAHLHVIRRRDGSWNASQLFPFPQFSDHSPPLSLRECTADFVDEAHPDRDPPHWRNVQVTLTPDAAAGKALGLPSDQSRKTIRIVGSMSGDHFREVRVEGTADLAAGLWSLLGEVDQLQFTPAMREKLPEDLALKLEPIAAVSGNTHLTFAVDNLAGPQAPLKFSVSGEISEGRIDDDRLPLPLTELSARLVADNAGLEINDLQARLGAAAIRLSLKMEGRYR